MNKLRARSRSTANFLEHPLAADRVNTDTSSHLRCIGWTEEHRSVEAASASIYGADSRNSGRFYISIGDVEEMFELTATNIEPFSLRSVNLANGCSGSTLHHFATSLLQPLSNAHYCQARTTSIGSHNNAIGGDVMRPRRV
jgi:hypothetical protein